LFESNEVEFIFPSSLYISRLERLERVHSSRLENETTVVEVYYAQENKIEDEDFQSYTGTLSRIEDSSDVVDPAIRGSGYNCLTVTWDSDSHDRFSPWDIRVLEASKDEPEPSCLGENDKKGIRRALSKLTVQHIYNAFKEPVDENRYIDYSLRVAVPMDLSFIERRIVSDYYGTKASVVADMRLIVENCIKYNGEHDNLSALAKQMLVSFETDILSTEDIATFQQFSKPLSTGPYSGLPIPQRRQEGSQQSNRRVNRVTRNPRASRAMSITNRANGSSVASSRSSLEALPQPRRPTMNRQHSVGLRNQNNAENDRLRSSGIQHSGDVTSPGRRSSRRSMIRHREYTLSAENGALMGSPQGARLQALRDQRAIRRNDRRVEVNNSLGQDQLVTDSIPSATNGSRDQRIASASHQRSRSSVRRNIGANDSLAALEVEHDESENSDEQSSSDGQRRQTRKSSRTRVVSQQVVQFRSRSNPDDILSERAPNNRNRATRSQTAGQIDSDYMDEREMVDEDDSSNGSSDSRKGTVSRSRRMQSREMATEEADSDNDSSEAQSESSDKDSDIDNERSDDQSDNDSQQPKRKMRRQESSPIRRKRPVRTNPHFVEGRIGREPQHRIIVRLRSSDKRPTRHTAVGQKTYQVPESDDDLEYDSVAESVQSSNDDDNAEMAVNRKRKSTLLLFCFSLTV
jgi:Bromodomain